MFHVLLPVNGHPWSRPSVTLTAWGARVRKPEQWLQKMRGPERGNQKHVASVTTHWFPQSFHTPTIATTNVCRTSKRSLARLIFFVLELRTSCWMMSLRPFCYLTLTPSQPSEIIRTAQGKTYCWVFWSVPKMKEKESAKTTHVKTTSPPQYINHLNL